MSPPPMNLFDELTPAERLVAIHVVEGLSNKEISTLLGKAEATVKHQVSAIFRAANVESRARFMAVYYQQYLCPLHSAKPSSRENPGESGPYLAVVQAGPIVRGKRQA